MDLLVHTYHPYCLANLPSHNFAIRRERKDAASVDNALKAAKLDAAARRWEAIGMSVVLRRHCFWLLVAVLCSGVFIATAQPRRTLEVQLAGVRLGAPVIDKDEAGNLKPTCLLRVWGLPDFIITPGMLPVQPGMMPGAPGMPMGPMMPGGPGAPMGMGSGFGGQPGVGAPIRRPGMAGPGAPPAGMPYGGPPMLGGEMPGGPMMPGMGATGTTPAVPVELAWAVPVFIPPQQNQRLWLYRRNGAALSFLEQDGVVIAIAVAGHHFPYARTALGDPFRSIQLGDELQRVLLRYGAPDSALLVGQMQPIPPTAVGIHSMVSLRYTERSNIEFLVVNNKVVRIFIFLPDRLPLR